MFKSFTFAAIAFCILISSNPAFSQKKKTENSVDATNSRQEINLFQLNQLVYDQAIKYNDLLVAREALYKMMLLKPERAGLKDTLTYLYYNSGNHMQVIMVGKEILEKTPNKPEVLEIVAVSQQNLGMLKDALESFEKLYQQTKDFFHLYNVASLQYMLKRYGECSETLNTIISSADESQKVNISNANGEGAQQVPIKAAAFNMRGVVALELQQTDVAKQNFNKALELFPDFTLAKSNLETVNASDKKETGKKK